MKILSQDKLHLVFVDDGVIMASKTYGEGEYKISYNNTILGCYDSEESCNTVLDYMLGQKVIVMPQKDKITKGEWQ